MVSRLLRHNATHLLISSTRSIDNQLMHIDWTKPTLDYVFEHNDSIPATYNVIDLPNANQWTYWIVQAIPGNFTDQVPHPIHLHGHDFSVLGQGVGTFTDANTLNYANPPRRDVAMLPAGGWLVIAFETDNPGAWLMHCHIGWHASEGFATQFMERRSEIASTFTDVSAMEDMCTAWDDYYPTSVYKQDDSGI